MTDNQTLTNTHTITINTTADQVWFALTNSSEISKYLSAMKVESSWMVGSPIVYSHYEPNGEITKWNGMDMLWKATIAKLVPNSIYELEYTDQSKGLVRETYTLESITDNQTKLTFVQVCLSEQMAKDYMEGNQYTLDALKNYLEKKVQLRSHK